jgi:hypothetical protein
MRTPCISFWHKRSPCIKHLRQDGLLHLEDTHHFVSWSRMKPPTWLEAAKEVAGGVPWASLPSYKCRCAWFEYFILLTIYHEFLTSDCLEISRDCMKRLMDYCLLLWACCKGSISPRLNPETNQTWTTVTVWNRQRNHFCTCQLCTLQMDASDEGLMWWKLRGPRCPWVRSLTPP